MFALLAEKKLLDDDPLGLLSSLDISEVHVAVWEDESSYSESVSVAGIFAGLTSSAPYSLGFLFLVSFIRI